jgi:ribonuclease R
VLERGTRTVVGTYYGTKKGGNVIPRDERFNRSLAVPKPDPALGLRDGAFVVANITEWTPSSQPLLGRVEEVLGDPETPGIDVTMIVRDAGVDPDFPSEALEEADAITDAIPDAETARRTDFRAASTFTMDGATAKDFDDALSVQRLPDGMWRLGVHIADVSHYVREGGALDREAYDRATSIYPVDRVVPMLPEKLSNNVCSLRPREDRLTLSVVMDIDSRGRVFDYSIHESVIRSAHRLVYEEVQEFLEGRAPVETLRELGPIRDDLDSLCELRRALTAMRLRRGALDLDMPETRVVFDADGAVKGIERRARLETHRVVEECMLIANEVIATHLFNLHVPSVYRVHEPPDINKLRQLQPVLAHLGIKFPAKHDITPEALQAALDRTARTETGFIARRLILRAMMQAHYDDENLGHYGLASRCYTHFTSPIRRYPDLLVHRLLREAMRAGAPMEGVYAPPGEPEPEQGMAGRRRISLMAPPPLPAERNDFLRARLGEWTAHCSERERRAQDIENDSTKIKSLEYMRQHLGEEFWGYVTSVLTWGFFVELEHLPVEGLVHVRNLQDDFYEFDEERMMLVGKQNGATFRLGDKVRVYVENVNVLSMELDFALIEKQVPEGSAERQAEMHRRRVERERRHDVRQPRHGGFQRRGRRR